ncbi:hypothetical protein C7M61_003852 [Candidozyma pseudohaemuli]|uniref:Major facilitator superfamily (MFS) profile domain-containing protein n=1 Tax=Candidozyma pseudohaemuli TaxID=418784 RepID=A0A2P7YK77_9ASCO|nr:hypothetical protein C7M61_003852 [[Candida] pseudohaemulonii]PSK36383.1 hypothetical protein C7M61_003852 [[Candida] pseudohaemulonii]
MAAKDDISDPSLGGKAYEEFSDDVEKKQGVVADVEPIDTAEAEDFSDIDEQKLLRRMDWRLLPLFTVLYLLSFLDRGNIANAKIEGLAEDLNLRNHQYNMCLTIFFIFYASLEIPSNMLLHRVKPRWFIPTTMVLWSIVMTLMGTVQKYEDLLACRALLGIFEAPLFPGISYILSMYYKKSEILMRQAIFFSAASVAGAFSGLLAAAIAQMDGVGGYEGWRWIFILEGLLTFVVGVYSYSVFPNYPKDCAFLLDKERRFVQWRVKFSSNAENKKMLGSGEESLSKTVGEDMLGSREYIWKAFKDWQIWVQLFICWGILVPLYGIALFAPSVIFALGYTSTQAQLMLAPPFICGAIICVVQAYFSDRVGYRAPFMIFSLLCIVMGFMVCLVFSPITQANSIYGAMFVLSIGAAGFPMTVIWLANNLGGTFKRAIGMAIQIGLGNFSGAFASNFYRDQDAPHYTLGHALELGFGCMGIIASLIAVTGYLLSNRKKRKDIAAGKYDDTSSEELVKMGDKSPYFVYRL